MYSKHDELISMGYGYFPRVERTEAHGFQDHVEKDNSLVCVTHLAHDVIDVIDIAMYTYADDGPMRDWRNFFGPW